MRVDKLVVILLILAVLLPMWAVAIQGEPPSEEIRIDQSVSEIRPLDGFVDTPNKLSPSQVGVVVWVALLALLGVLSFFHRFMNYAARPDPDEQAVSDGGTVRPSFPWIETEDRWIVEYAPASDALAGLVAMGGLTVLTIVFAALFTGEYLTLARTQYFGIYAFGMFMSLTGLTVSYYAWFMPHVEVAERRGHS
ncbi:hypothetical protein [Haloarchaeobius litoreus]|uniref:Uncharacterized protein n=1 Tax=Haloarchaeobius litoreus TaxID=755306 RepID=A0ABD6DMU3_9EURY|nr:hypothetical protein [Haloarchaeobius litoreus]